MKPPVPVIIALGSNLGDRRRNLRSAVAKLGAFVRVVRLSGVWESDPVDCPPGSSPFLNMVIAAVAKSSPGELLARLHEIEHKIGRRRRVRNEPRTIDLDLIFYGAGLSRGRSPSIPHRRFATRQFVLAPFAELGLDWFVAGIRVRSLKGEGAVRLAGPLY